MKFGRKIDHFTDILKSDSIVFYNVVKIVLIALLIVFIAALLSGNADSEQSAEAVARAVVPQLMQADNSASENDPLFSEQGETAELPEATGGDTGESNDDVSNESVEGVFDGMGQADALDFKRIFGLNAEDYDGTAYFKPISQMDVEELLIVRLQSDDQAEDLEEAAEERIKNQKTSFDGYGAAQCALLEKAIVKIKGNFFFYCVSPEAEKYYNAFLDAI